MLCYWMAHDAEMGAFWHGFLANQVRLISSQKPAVAAEEEATLRSNRLTAYFAAYVSNEGAMLRQLHNT